MCSVHVHDYATIGVYFASSSYGFPWKWSLAVYAASSLQYVCVGRTTAVQVAEMQFALKPYCLVQVGFGFYIRILLLLWLSFDSNILDVINWEIGDTCGPWNSVVAVYVCVMAHYLFNNVPRQKKKNHWYGTFANLATNVIILFLQKLGWNNNAVVTTAISRPYYIPIYSIYTGQRDVPLSLTILVYNETVVRIGASNQVRLLQPLSHRAGSYETSHFFHRHDRLSAFQRALFSIIDTNFGTRNIWIYLW